MPPSPDTKISEATFIAEVLRAEAEAILRIAEGSEASSSHWSKALDLLASCSGHVIVSGMGKSGLVGQKISATLASLGQPSHFIHPAEAVHGDLGRIRRGDIVMLLSYSGNTEEVVNLAAILRADGVKTLGLSRDNSTHLAELCTTHLAVGDVTEACPLNLAPTASTTAQLAIGDSLALALSRRRHFSADDFHRHHPGGMLGAGLRKITEVLRFRVEENLPVIPDHLSVQEALVQARKQAAGSRRAGAMLLVNRDGQLSGLFTDGDLRRLLVIKEDDPTALLHQPIGEVMTPHPRHLTVNDLVRDAVQLIREHRVDEIPVLDMQGKPVGLVDVQDLIAMKVVQE